MSKNGEQKKNGGMQPSIGCQDSVYFHTNSGRMEVSVAKVTEHPEGAATKGSPVTATLDGTSHQLTLERFLHLKILL